MIKWENKIIEVEEGEDDEMEDFGLAEAERQAQKCDEKRGGVNKSVNLTIHGRKMALPEGSSSKSLALYEEIFIPPPVDSNKQFLASFDRVKINTLDEVCFF
jgi:hypothetical protein